MKKLKLAWNILKKLNVDKIIASFAILTIVCSFILARVEPQIENIWDGIWYCFIAFTTIGFGDIIATTFIGKIITIIITICGIILVAIITGVLVNYYEEINRIKVKESTELFLDKLEKLPELSKEELKQISDKVKAREFKL